MSERKSRQRAVIRIGAILRARCPACQEGPVLRGVFGIHRKCPVCGYDFHPEPGFYLGAMAVSFLVTAILTIPPLVALKLLNVGIDILIAYPLVQFVFLGSFLMIYSRVLWLHLEHRMTAHLDGGGINGAKPAASETGSDRSL